LVRRLPELFDLRVKARSLAYLFVAGATLGLLTLAFPHDEMVEELQLFVLAAIAFAIAAVVYLAADRIQAWQLHAAVAAGTLLVTFANYYVGPTALYPLLYTWSAMYAFYFFRLSIALVHVAFIALCYAVLLVIQEPASPVVHWLLAVGTPCIAGLLISRLLGHLRGEAATAEHRERELRASEARTRLVLDSAPDAFIAIDRDGIVTSWNAAAERLFGWSASEAVGNPVRNLVFPRDERPAFDERRRQLLESPETVKVLSIESEMQRRDGSLFPAERTISRVRIASETVLTAFVRDVTDRRRAQQEREALLREQAARAEAERVAQMVSGMQMLVDAALAHRTLHDIVADLVTRVCAVLGADAATIFLAEDGRELRIGASSGSAGDEPEPTVIAFGEGFAGQVATAREAMLKQDPDEDEIQDPALRRLDIGSLIGVPLLADEVIGVLVVAAAAPRHFTTEEIGLLRLAADRVAITIEHARVYEREHRLAVTLQQSLLPETVPKLPGLDVGARYMPAAAEEGVGGDWYDVIPIPGGRVGLVMGDVAGKGLAAASMVGRLRSALRAYALEGHDAARVVEQLNRLVWTDADEGEMATLLYAVADPGEGVLGWVNAGHLPPLLLPRDRMPHYLDGGSSVPLGVLPFPAYEEVSVRMEEGATVVLYTDGLVERAGRHIDEGMEALATVLRDAPDDAEALCEHVPAALVPKPGPYDDVAVLALRNIPLEARFTVEFPTDPEALASMRGLLRRWLRQAQGTDQEIAEITTACGEAATNAIEHAGAAGGTPFEVVGARDGLVVDITVRDHGAWRAPREGDQGRGISLMRALMDTVEVTPTAEGTTVRLRRTLNGNGG
jgi:PAS domain S-box-containing protein